MFKLVDKKIITILCQENVLTLIYGLLSAGGGEKARHRHVSRGKLLPRDRIGKLLDPE